MNSKINYSKYFSSPDLLAQIILEQYEKDFGKIEYPVNPFKILKSLDVKLVVRNFKKIEGLYLPATADDDIDIVAINFNRPLYRQRFTAAHEICHCIKDKKNPIICPITGKKSAIEKFADNFAAALLMPINELKKQVYKYLNKDGYIDLNNVIYISEYFGVSFESCVFNIAYKLKKISGEIQSDKLKKRIKQAKPENLREKFGIKNTLNLTREMINYYCYARPKENMATNIKFKQFLVLNENRLEGININERQINYILADLRLNHNFSKYGNENDTNLLEALGNIELLEYVLNTDDKIDIWKLQKMQNLLFKYTPYGYMLPFPRQENNRINGAKISTVDYKNIPEELIKVGDCIKKLLDRKDFLSFHEYILEAVKIHHKLTVIHPLINGNGRCCRAILLWLLRLKNIPPFYIKIEDKPEYLKALTIIDTEENYDYLELFILKQIINSMIILNENLEL